MLNPLQSLDFLLLHLLTTSINSSSVMGNIDIELLFVIYDDFKRIHISIGNILH